MAFDVVTCAHGRPAAEALAQVVRAAKAGDPLAGATVVVPTNYVGVATRRLLASGRLGPLAERGTGLAGVGFLTLYRLAELMGAPQLAAAGRRPVSTPVVAAAVRAVLAEAPGVFEQVARHPATERALVRSHRELSDVSAGALDTLAAQSRRAGDVVRIHRQVKDRLRDRWYDESDLCAAAVTAATEGSAVTAQLGHLVLYLPEDISVATASVAQAAAGLTPATVIAAFTGAPDADATTLRSLARLGVAAKPSAAAPATAHGTAILSGSDADEEVRAVVRAVVHAAREGVPLDRMALLYGADEPYGRLVHEQLADAGIVHNSAGVRRLDETLVGRALLGLLALPDREFRRPELFALLSSAPIRRPDGPFAPSAAWERISRRAGIVAGLDEWEQRLTRFAADQVAEADRRDADPADERSGTHLRRSAGWADDLRQFVADLATDVDPATAPRSWRGKCRWAERLIRRYLGGPHTRADWPSEEVDAAEQLEATLDRLAGLDDVEPGPSLAVFRRTLELELEANTIGLGGLGQGILVGRIGSALGLDLDRVFAVGLAEGTFPGHRRDDSLLPDNERLPVADELPLTGGRIGDDHRALLTSLAAASGERLLAYPRGDLRRSSERVPSRWLLDTATALEGGSSVFSEDVSRLRTRPWFTEVPSFAAGLRRTSFPATSQEYDLASLLHHTGAGGKAGEHALTNSDTGFAAGVALAAARASRAFTRFDGDLSGLDPEQRAALDSSRRVMSATRLEAWAGCPHRYLVGYVLGVQPIETPELRRVISPIDRGNIVHHALDRFLRSVMGDDALPGPDEDWSDAHRHLLEQLTADEAKLYEDRGLTGAPVFWRRERQQIQRELARVLDEDTARRREAKTVPVASELAFGLPDAGHPAIAVQLSDGRELRLRGSIDRVDRTADGSLEVVDYKTGRPDSYRGLSEAEPHQAGTRLQLPSYALAAEAVLGPSAGPVTSMYWFITDRGGYKRIGYQVTDDVLSSFDRALRAIVDGIEAGIFPAIPPATDTYGAYVECPYCDPDGLGTRDRRREWERKAAAPQLEPLRRLVEPETLDVS